MKDALPTVQYFTSKFVPPDAVAGEMTTNVPGVPPITLTDHPPTEADEATTVPNPHYSRSSSPVDLKPQN